jgi:hypothetical protein
VRDSNSSMAQEVSKLSRERGEQDARLTEFKSDFEQVRHGDRVCVAAYANNFQECLFSRYMGKVIGAVWWLSRRGISTRMCFAHRSFHGLVGGLWFAPDCDAAACVARARVFR